MTKIANAPGVIYEMRFHGQYFTQERGRTKGYEFTVKMDENAKELGFLHVFVRQVLTDPDFQTLARQKYPDWKRHYTHYEDGGTVIQPDGTRNPVRELALMNYRQLSSYISKQGIPVEVDLYPTVAELKQALVDYRDNQKAFLENQDKRYATEGKQLKVLSGLRYLNNWSVSESETNTAYEGKQGKKDNTAEAVPTDLEAADELRRILEEV